VLPVGCEQRRGALAVRTESGTLELQSVARRYPYVTTSETGLPRYLTLVRTETRIRDDQAAALAALRRRVAAARTDKKERITDNTLVRVAIDLLLAHADELAGNTEEEIRRSVVPGPAQCSCQCRP
jgi:hypothetical protein